MATVNETVILEINVEKTIEQLTTYQRTLEALKKSRDELTEAVKAGGAEEQKNRQALENTNIAIKQATQEYKTQQNIYTSYLEQKKRGTQIENFNNNSIKANRELLKQLTAQYIELKNPSKAATDTINNLTATLKKQEAAIGDTRRNVGNYKNDILDAIGTIKGFGGSLGAVINPIKNLGGAFGGAELGVKGFSAALLTTGLPIFIAAVQFLVSAFSKFKPIVDLVKDTLGGLGEVVTVITGSLYRFAQGADDAFSNFGDKAAEAYEQGVRFAQAQREIEDRTRTLILTEASLSKEINKLLIQARDRTKTEKERIELLDEASAKEKLLSDERIANAKAEADLAAEKFGASIKQGILDEELQQKANEAGANLLRLQQESQTLTETINNRRNALIDQERQKRISNLDRDAKIQIETGKATAESLVSIERQKTKAILEDEGLQEADRQRILKESLLEQQKIRQDFANKQRQDLATSARLNAEVLKLAGESGVDELVKAEELQRDALLNNAKLTAKERENIEVQSALNIVKLRNDASKKIIEETIASEAIIIENLKRAGESTTAAQVQLELNRRDLLLKNLTLTTKERENIIRQSELNIQGIYASSTQQILNLQNKANQIELTELERSLQNKRNAREATAFDEAAFVQDKANILIEIERTKQEQIIADLTKSEQEKQLLILESNNNIVQITKDAEFQISQIQRKQLNEYINIAQQGLSQILSTIEQFNEIRNEAEDAELERDERINEQKKENYKRQLDARKISQEEYDAAILNLDNEFNKKAAQIKRDQFERDREARIATTILNTATAVISAFATSGNIYAGIALAAVAAVAGATQLAIISSQPTPEFALGGEYKGGENGILVGGKKHSQGGTKYKGEDGNRFEVERGERLFVLKANASERINELSQWNQLFGGRAWNDAPVSHAATGGQINDGGFIIREASNKVDNNILLENAIRRGFKNAPAPVLSIVELESKQNDRNRSIAISED